MDVIFINCFFLVNIVFKHLLLPKQKGDVSPVVIVTILVDEISFGYKAKVMRHIIIYLFLISLVKGFDLAT